LSQRPERRELRRSIGLATPFQRIAIRFDKVTGDFLAVLLASAPRWLRRWDRARSKPALRDDRFDD
jgi:hypothetical protein